MRRLGWYYHHAGRVIAVMLGVFFLAAGWRIGDQSGLLFAAVALAAVFGIALMCSGYEYSKVGFRVILYCACVFFAYQMTDTKVALEQEYWFMAYMGLLVVFLAVAIRMTRSQEFTLTTQDLLILLVVVLAPLMPFEGIEQYAIGSIALIVAVLMYTSEFVLIRSTRMVAFSVACAVAGVLLVIPLGN